MTTNQDHITMIKQFRVLAIPKETKAYDTELLMGIFDCHNPALDVVDSVPPTTALNIITNDGWIAVADVTNCVTHICIPFVKDIE